MTIDDLIKALDSASPDVVFSDVMSAIDAAFAFTPCAFDNGGQSNSADENQGSCKVFAFAQHAHLDKEKTLRLFAEHYQSVLDDPQGSAHGNIRAFMQSGWDGVTLHGNPLTPR